MSGQGDNLAGISPDNIRITRKNKIKKNLDISIIRKETIIEPVKPRKRAKEDTLNDEEKASIKKHFHIFNIR